MKILIPVDGSECSKETLAWASSFLDREKCKIYLLNVVTLMPDVPVTDFEMEMSVKMLNDARVLLTEKGFRVESAQYVLGVPATAICEYAEEMAVDQIILGSHGRGGLAKFLMGSVSEGVFRCSQKPVLIYNNGPKPSLRVSHLETVNLTEV